MKNAHKLDRNERKPPDSKPRLPLADQQEFLGIAAEVVERWGARPDQATPKQRRVLEQLLETAQHLELQAPPPKPLPNKPELLKKLLDEADSFIKFAEAFVNTFLHLQLPFPLD